MTFLGLLLLAAAPPELFADRAADWGLDFVHQNGMSGQLYFVETMGAGGALLDYDGDGDLDVFLVQGALLALDDPSRATFPPPPRMLPLIDRLYRNDGVGFPGGRFVDVTASSGVVDGDYGMGVATGDYDGDGSVDLYVTNFGPDRLFRNRGDGTFEDATAKAGIENPAWSVPAVFFDPDRDGDLDLFVGNYVDYRLGSDVVCLAPTSARDYCGPTAFRPAPDRFFVNRGDGTFEDATARSGFRAADGPALGAIAGDFDGDGDADLYVANDQAPNQLWLQQPDGTFQDGALLAGVAVDGAGRSQASMGIDAADVDGDLDEDLFITNLFGETNTLYQNDGGGFFRDATVRFGLAAPSLPFTSFGTGYLDVEHDGRLDLVVVSGDVKRIEAQVRRNDPFPLAQTKQLFRQQATGRFVDASAEAGPAFAQAEVSRGLALGDIDLDGDTDVLVTQDAGPVRLLANRIGQDRPSIQVRVRDRNGADALGAVVEIAPAGAHPRARRTLRTAASYASANAPEVHFGLGGAREVRELGVLWPTGRRRTIQGALPAGTTLVVVP
jgi:hypothetical protein